MRIRLVSRRRKRLAPFAWVALTTLLGPAQIFAASDSDGGPRPRSARPGLAIGVGTGPAYAHLGPQLLYFQPLPNRWTLFGSAAVGKLPDREDSYLDLSGHAPAVWGAAFAVGATFGRNHRACVDLGWGALATQDLAIEGLVIDASARYGVFVDAGYEFLANNGLFARLLPLGIGHVTDPRLESKQRWSWNISAGLGWKLW